MNDDALSSSSISIPKYWEPEDVVNVPLPCIALRLSSARLQSTVIGPFIDREHLDKWNEKYGDVGHTVYMELRSPTELKGIK